MGCSLLSWGILGLIHDHRTFGITPVRISISLLHFCVCALFLFRQLEIRAATVRQHILVLPCFVFCGFLFVNAQNISLWPLYCEVIFVMGTTIAICSYCAEPGHCEDLCPHKDHDEDEDAQSSSDESDYCSSNASDDLGM